VTAYSARLTLTGLSPTAVDTVKQSVFAGVAVAGTLHSTALLDSVRSSFVAGMDAALVVSAGAGAIALVLALVFLPGPAPSEALTESPAAEKAA
jgi:DHA2 family multidrug resistance protein-like MFS transporter